MAVTWPSGSGVCDQAKVLNAPAMTKAHKIVREPGVINSSTRCGNLSTNFTANVDHRDRMKWITRYARFPKSFAANQPASSLPTSNRPPAISQPSPDELIHHKLSTPPPHNQ